jgi:serine/threonine protein kinase
MADPPDSPRTPPPRPPETEVLPPAAPPATPPAGTTPGGSSSADTVAIGSFGDYELLDLIERGGMGIVYKARERRSGRLVALKMMLQETATGPGDLRRFVLEARATGELTHPGVVAIHAWGEHEGHPFYTMDFVPGVPLSRLLENGPLPCDRAVGYLLGIAHAVGAAHALGIVHRDLKPSNVIIDPADQPRVLDFGLAKRHRPGPPAEETIPEALPADAPAPAPAARHTEKGIILGTPSYMAPEQVRAEHDRVGPAADVHALGAIFYEMVTGRPPFQGETTYETLMQVLHQAPAPLESRAAGVPAALEEFCRRCLEKDPLLRYRHAGALADDLERRWRRAASAGRFRRLARRAALALLLLAVVSVLATGLAAPDLANWPAWPDEPTRAAEVVVLRLLAVAVLVIAPYLAELGLAVWLCAWAANADRPLRIAAACGGVAAGVVAVSLADGLSVLRGPPLFLAWLLAGNTLAVLGAVLYRRLSGADRSQGDGAAPAGDPYLQRLFAVRSDARPRPGVRPGTAQAPGLEDFEPGKALYRWDDHEVYWARQKSLDRPTLVWLDHTSAEGDEGRSRGVMVRHPGVLGLHAVGAGPRGRYLVTEPVAASALDELVGQRGLTPPEAAALTARLARAVQAFHDQGACHGRLRADWVLVRGDLEPVLCPCGFPSQAAEDRVRDVLDLGRLLQGWLPPRPRGWAAGVLMPLYLTPLHRIAEAAAAGAYARPADLADDLDRAARHVQIRWRERVSLALVLLLVAGPLAFPFVAWLLTVTGVINAQDAGRAELHGGAAAGYLLLALTPAAALLGYTHGRALALRWPGRGQWRGLGRRGRLPEEVWPRLVPAALFALAAGVLAWFHLPGSGGTAPELRTLLRIAAAFLGCWVLGAFAAGVVTFLGLLFRSLQPAPPPGAGHQARDVG